MVQLVWLRGEAVQVGCHRTRWRLLTARQNAFCPFYTHLHAALRCAPFRYTLYYAAPHARTSKRRALATATAHPPAPIHATRDYATAAPLLPRLFSHCASPRLPATTQPHRLLHTLRTWSVLASTITCFTVTTYYTTPRFPARSTYHCGYRLHNAHGGRMTPPAPTFGSTASTRSVRACARRTLRANAAPHFYHARRTACRWAVGRG